LSADDSGLARCLLHVFVDSCKDLSAGGKNPADKPSPKVELRVGQADARQTFPQYMTSEPVYEQGFVFLVANPDSDDLTVRVLDSAKKDACVGQALLRVSDVLAYPNMEMTSQPLHLKGVGAGKQATIVISAQVRGLLPPKVKQSGARADDDLPVKVPDVAEPARDVAASDPVEVKARESIKPAEKENRPHPPSMDEVITATIKPAVEAAAGNLQEAEAMLKPVSEVRRRTGVDGRGRIKITLKYDQDEREMNVTVHKASGLPGADLPDPPDPYVKLYLLPERKSKSKRKTETVKDTTEPEYEESFEYSIGSGELAETQLEVSVVDKKGVFARNSLMGRAIVPLADPRAISGFTEW